MTLTAGTRLGPYEIASLIGAGGMGEVYRARDTRLDRTVAIKVLPAAHASDVEFRERFEREARSISALSHAHICTLYDVGAATPEGGTGGAVPATDTPVVVSYLVMEHLDGDTLAARLGRGALPLGEALRVACEIASALDAAHRQGIVHRDLKPGNVMLTRAGAKLLDFGLAKVGPARDALSGSAAPTVMGPLTARGTILGTFQYMAPEQIEGGEADARTDIFAFGTMLFEMLTGRKAFEGKTQASLLGAILRDEVPPISQTQPVATPLLDHVVRTCLAKDPDDRFQTAHDLLLQLRWIAASGSAAGVPTPVAARRRLRERRAWVAFGVVTALWLVTLAWAARSLLEQPAPHQVQFAVETPGAALTSPVSLSPDGRFLVFSAPGASGALELWLRRLATAEVELLAGTEGALWAFWAPDSRSIAFDAGRRLRRAEVAGGMPQTVTNLPADLTGGTWSDDGVIVFSARGTLYRVAATGGEPRELLRPDQTGHDGYYFPFFLPDGHRFLFAARGSGSTVNGIYAGSIDAAPPALVVGADSMPVYAAPGFLLYTREGALLAQPFDARTLELAGEPVQIAEQVSAVTNGRLAVTASANGLIAYRSGVPPEADLVWFDREGKLVRTSGEPRRYISVRLSPDGRLIAALEVDANTRLRSIWTIDRPTNIMSRLTEDEDLGDVVWSPDSREVAFWSRRSGRTHIHRQAVGSSGDAVLYESPVDQTWPDDWSADGRFFLFHRAGQLFSLVLGSDDAAQPIGQSPPLVDQARFSPDGRWVAYGSNRSGAWEVYVAPFPAFDNRRPISRGGGGQVNWRGDGRELFYLSPSGEMMSVLATPVRPGTDELEFQPPTRLFQSPIPRPAMNTDWYEVTRDGQEFVFIRQRGSGDGSAPLTVVVNWTARLNR